MESCPKPCASIQNRNRGGAVEGIRIQIKRCIGVISVELESK